MINYTNYVNYLIIKQFEGKAAAKKRDKQYKRVKSELWVQYLHWVGDKVRVGVGDPVEVLCEVY